MELLYIPQCIHDHLHLLAPQLRIYPLQCPLEVQPEVDILECRVGGDVSRELGHRLDGFDPRIDVRVERVLMECARCWVNVGSLALRLGLY